MKQSSKMAVHGQAPPPAQERKKQNVMASLDLKEIS